MFKTNKTKHFAITATILVLLARWLQVLGKKMMRFLAKKMNCCHVVPGRAAAKVLEVKTGCKDQRPIRVFLRHKNNELLKLGGAATNEQMVADMSMK